MWAWLPAPSHEEAELSATFVPLIEESVLRKVLAAALATGARFAEVFAERRFSRSVRLEDRRVEELSGGIDLGAGVRVVWGESSAYAYTNRLDLEGLLEAARVARAGVHEGSPLEVCDLTEAHPPVKHPVRLAPEDVPQSDMVEVCRRADEAARAVDPAVSQVLVGVGDSRQRILIANSEGLLVHEDRVRTRLTCHVVAVKDGEFRTGGEGPGAACGFELFDSHPPEKVGRLAAERAVAMLPARPAPAGEMTVVLAAGGGGVLFHEACGHGLEADLVAKQASVYGGRLGERIASPLLNGVDDATDVNAWGSFGFDDEGTPAQRTVLFSNGELGGYLSDRLRARELAIQASGNGRRQSYAHLPIPRMTNTYILPGDSDPQEIIRQTAKGLYAKGLGGGEVNPATGDFVFGVDEGYMIENGELTYPVRGANLVGNGPTVLAAVDAVGSDFDTRQGMCGKDGQGAPVAFGTPTLRIARITVGGTGA